MSGAATRGGRVSGRRAARGFTMIEVLLAVALFAVAILVLASSYLNILQSLEAVKMDHALNEELRWLRERVLSEGDRDALEKGGDVKTLDFGNARWSVVISPTEVADLFSVELSVELGDTEKDRKQKTSTMQVLRPTWSQAVDRGKIMADVKTRIEKDRADRGIVSAARPTNRR